MKHLGGLFAAGLASVMFAGNAGAALVAVDLGGIPAYYDTVLNITWLADANYAATNGFASTGGRMTFTEAQTWTASLDIGGFTGWRPANVAQPDPSCGGQDPTFGSTGFSCTDGELGYMFYIEMAGASRVGPSHNATYDLFTNVADSPSPVLGNTEYWSETALPLSADPRGLAYFLYETNNGDGQLAGFVSLDFVTNDKLVWVVHDGNLGVDAVPEPASLTLLGSGLALLAIRRRRSRGPLL